MPTPTPTPTNWTWGQPIQYKFDYQNPHNYIQFVNALWERWLATSLSAVPGYSLYTFSCPWFKTNPWAIPSKMNLSPVELTTNNPPKPKPINIQNTLDSFSGNPQALYNPGNPTDTTIVKTGFNYKGIGELEAIGYWLLQSNFVDPAKVDPTTFNINTNLPRTINQPRIIFTHYPYYTDPYFFIANNFDFGATEWGSGVAKLLGQRSYPRRRRPREIKWNPATDTRDTISGQSGNFNNSSTAPVNSIAYGCAFYPTGAPNFYPANTIVSLVIGMFKHVGGGTWYRIWDTDKVAADTMDSEYPTTHSQYIVPGTIQTGDYIDECKFEELYQICKICQTTAFSGELFADAYDGLASGNLPGKYIQLHTTTGWSNVTSTPIFVTLPLNPTQGLSVSATNDTFPVQQNVRWKLGFPFVWKGISSQIKFYVCVDSRGSPSPQTVFDDQGAGFKDQHWNLWDSVNLSGGDQTYSQVISKEWNPHNGPPSTSKVSGTAPPQIRAGLNFTDFMITMKWGFTYA